MTNQLINQSPNDLIPMTKSDLCLEFDHVRHRFDDAPSDVLRDITLSVPFGSFIAIVGASGIGKSTLLRLASGLIEPTRGTILLAGQPVTEKADPIGWVFQKDNLMPWRTVTDNIALPLELQGLDKGMVNERVDKLLRLVRLEQAAQQYPAQLSGGMAQRVAIARALSHEPPLLLLDEPFGALDALTRERMGQELLRIWQARPVTVLMVTHSISEAVFLADEVLVLNGRPATITHRLAVDLPRPRQMEMEQTAAFQKIVAQVRGAIRL